MKRASFVLMAIAALSACTDIADTPLDPASLGNHNRPDIAIVTTNADAGPGSLRAAIESANDDPVVQIVQVAPGLGPIALASTIAFTGPQALTLFGSGIVLEGGALPSGEGAFLANGGGALTIKDLTVQNAPGVGITVAVPPTSTGAARVTLGRVNALHNGGHGVLINDQAEYFSDPNSTSESGSDADVIVDIRGCRFVGNGFTDLDRDGLRVNEGGFGNLIAFIDGTLVLENGGDGIELDERASGDANFEVYNTLFLRNGSFSSVDFDDGIDVDELSEGHIIAKMRKVSANDNFEEGIDLNENGPGDLRVDMTSVEASRNPEEGIDLEEDDDIAGGGDLIANLNWITTNGNTGGDGGLKIREKGDGHLSTRIFNATANDNEVVGIHVREDAGGNLDAIIMHTTADGNSDDGIEFDENAAGNFTGFLSKVVASNNTGFGVRADQGGAGLGTLHLVTFTALGNTVGAFVANAAITVTVTP